MAFATLNALDNADATTEAALWGVVRDVAA